MSEALKETEKYRRGILLSLLSQCTEPQQLFFKRKKHAR